MERARRRAMAKRFAGRRTPNLLMLSISFIRV